MLESTKTASVSQMQKGAEYTETRKRYWDEYAPNLQRRKLLRSFYRQRLQKVYSFFIPPGMRVLELGCGQGDLLAALRPSLGVGVDLSPVIVSSARQRHPDLQFVEGDAQNIDLGMKFDYIVCSDLVNDVWDVQKVFENIRRHCGPSTRLVLNSYSRVWELPRRVAEAFGIVKKMLPQNWLMVSDVVNLLYLENFELIRQSPEVLLPMRLPLIDRLANKYLVKLPLFNRLALTHVVVARPIPEPVKEREAVVTVVVAARNEAGNIAHIFDRVPHMGDGTELIFVEGNSSDNTYETIEAEIKRRPEVNARLYKQPGKGKGDAVRVGFQNATGEVLMILDADLTVAPEDLPRFYEAWRSGKADFVNGVRLIYPMENRAMKFFNHIGNRFFSFAFTWLLNQSIKDTLCGTKVLSKRDYEVIAANRAYFGEIDPFGDFDLLFGAAKYNLKIVDMPIRYAERTYGETNIQRWRHGVILLRMVMLAMRRIKFF